MRIVLAIGIIGLAVGCSRTTPESTSKRTPPPEPEELTEVTYGWYHVNPELAALCAGPSMEQIAATRKEHGPHGAELIRVFMNPRAKAALEANTPYPEGSIVQKRKQSGAVGKMVKHEQGFDERYGDWEFFYKEAGGKELPMPAKACADCHATTRKTDYVFATWEPVRQLSK